MVDQWYLFTFTELAGMMHCKPDAMASPMIWCPGQGGLQLQYTSKLREFEDFVGRAKLPALALAPSAKAQAPVSSAAAGRHMAGSQAQAQQPKLLVVEDLPNASGADNRRQLAEALRACSLCLRVLACLHALA